MGKEGIYLQDEDLFANAEQFEYLLPRPICGFVEYAWNFDGWVEVETYDDN